MKEKIFNVLSTMFRSFFNTLATYNRDIWKATSVVQMFRVEQYATDSLVYGFQLSLYSQ